MHVVVPRHWWGVWRDAGGGDVGGVRFQRRFRCLRRGGCGGGGDGRGDEGCGVEVVDAALVAQDEKAVFIAKQGQIQKSNNPDVLSLARLKDYHYDPKNTSLRRSLLGILRPIKSFFNRNSSVKPVAPAIRFADFSEYPPDELIPYLD